MREVLRLVWKLIKEGGNLVAILMSIFITCEMCYHGYHGDYARAAYEGVIVLIVNRWIYRTEEE